jgi:hypothetical protein
MAAEFLERGWNVVGTVLPGAGRPLLHDLADDCPGRVVVEVLDINEPVQMTSLRERLSGTTFEMLFVNAGTTGLPMLGSGMLHPPLTVTYPSQGE